MISYYSVAYNEYQLKDVDLIITLFNVVYDCIIQKVICYLFKNHFGLKNILMETWKNWWMRMVH